MAAVTPVSNPARREDVQLFKAILNGDHIARGFRNADIRALLFGTPRKSDVRNAEPSAAVGRLLKRLHVRHLAAKIPRTRRWAGHRNAAGNSCSASPYSCIAAPGHNWQHDRRLRSENFSASCREVHWKESKQAEAKHVAAGEENVGKH